MERSFQQGSPGTGTAPRVVRRDAPGDVVLACEHASRDIPPPWSGLGLDARAARSHAAWDVGANALALALGVRLEAPLVAASVSRLVHDANRPPGDDSAVPARVELVDVPGNADIVESDRAARVAAAHAPFHAALTALLDWRASLGLPSCLVTVHSFNPTWHGEPRSVELGVLHDADARLADALLRALDATGEAERFAVRRNAPYGPDDGVTWTLAEHGLARGLPNVMIEVRSDLIADAAGVERLAAALAPPIAAAVRDVLGPLAHEARAGGRVGAAGAGPAPGPAPGGGG